MPTNWPSSVDSFVNPTAASEVDASLGPPGLPAHHVAHSNHNDAIVAIETDIAPTGGGIKGSPRGYTQQQYFAQATLTDGPTVNWNLNTQQAATVTIAGSRTLANPTNMQAGATYTLIVVQGPGGNHTLVYGSAYKFPGGIQPTLSTAPGAIDVLTFLCDGTRMLGVAQIGFA